VDVVIVRAKSEAQAKEKLVVNVSPQGQRGKKSAAGGARKQPLDFAEHGFGGVVTRDVPEDLLPAGIKGLPVLIGAIYCVRNSPVLDDRTAEQGESRTILVCPLCHRIGHVLRPTHLSREDRLQRPFRATAEHRNHAHCLTGAEK